VAGVEIDCSDIFLDRFSSVPLKAYEDTDNRTIATSAVLVKFRVRFPLSRISNEKIFGAVLLR
jgi:hypothetical protein